MPERALRVRIASPFGAPDLPEVSVRPAPGFPDGYWALDGHVVEAWLVRGAGPRATLRVDDRRVGLLVRPAAPTGGPRPGQHQEGLAMEIVVDGWRLEVSIRDAARAELRDRASMGRIGPAALPPAEVRAIIPGRVAIVHIAEGETVEAGQTLLVVEAMKMQNELRAPRAGTVRRVAASAGRTVEAGALLVMIE